MIMYDEYLILYGLCAGTLCWARAEFRLVLMLANQRLEVANQNVAARSLENAVRVRDVPLLPRK